MTRAAIVGPELSGTMASAWRSCVALWRRATIGRMAGATCPACRKPRDPNDYMCPACWARLPAPTREALYAWDGRRIKRYSALRRALEAGIPLEQITFATDA